MDTHDRLTFNFALPNCSELPTFFVYDRLNIPDLIYFSVTDFIQFWSLDFVLVQSIDTNMPHKRAADSTVALYGSSGIR